MSSPEQDDGTFVAPSLAAGLVIRRLWALTIGDVVSGLAFGWLWDYADLR